MSGHDDLRAEQRRALRTRDRPVPPPMDETWREDAACAGVDTNLFFTAGDYITADARALCDSCPVRDPCLDYALRQPEIQGTWAGTDQRQRRNLRRRRARTLRKAAS